MVLAALFVVNQEDQNKAKVHRTLASLFMVFAVVWANYDWYTNGALSMMSYIILVSGVFFLVGRKILGKLTATVQEPLTVITIGLGGMILARLVWGGVDLSVAPSHGVAALYFFLRLADHISATTFGFV